MVFSRPSLIHSVVVATLFVGACRSYRSIEVPSSSRDASPGDGARTEVDASACRTDKLTFTRDTGCRNDGSVELCLPRDDAESQRALRAIESNVETMVGSSGRAGCDHDRETLFLVPAHGDACESEHGAMTLAAWEKLCAITRLDAVTRIVPTFYE